MLICTRSLPYKLYHVVSAIYSLSLHPGKISSTDSLLFFIDVMLNGTILYTLKNGHSLPVNIRMYELFLVMILILNKLHTPLNASTLLCKIQ